MTVETAGLRRNLNRFETAVVVIVIGVLTAIFHQRMQRLEAEMDHAAVDLMINQLRTQLLIFQAEMAITGKNGRLADYEGGNPFTLLSTAPSNYGGEIDGDRPEKMAPGQWYFDGRDGWIIYRVVNDRYFKSDLGGPGRLRYRLSLDYQDVNGNGLYDAGVDRIQGLVLKKLDHYEWTEK